MKKFLFCLVTALIFTLQASARIAVICDVVYEKSIGEWSEYYRREVEFMSSSELGRMFENKLYAVIWFSQTNCAIIQMEYNGIIMGEIDKSFMHTYLCFDLLNEGKLGVQVNSNDGEIKWRIYGKDENSLLIDPMFESYPYNSYNDGVRNNIRQGIVNRRQRPAEERKYAGLDKGVVAFSYGDCYIIGTRFNYIVALKKTFTSFYGHLDRGDIVFGKFSHTGETEILNGTQDNYGPTAIVKFIGRDYYACADWVKENVSFD